MQFKRYKEKVFFDTLKTLRNTRRQENRSDRRTKVRRGAVDTVSKNAFAQPLFTAVRNSFLFIGFLVCAGLLFCIFAVRGFINSLQTLRSTRRQGNRPDRRTKVRRGAVDAVSKNVFAQPFFTAVRNSFTYMIFYYSPHYFIRIFAVRGFINSLPCICMTLQCFITL